MGCTLITLGIAEHTHVISCSDEHEVMITGRVFNAATPKRSENIVALVVGPLQDKASEN